MFWLEFNHYTRMSTRMPHHIRCLMAGLMLVTAADGRAMSIGDIEVVSYLGEPLAATVPVRLDESVLPQNACFQLTEATRHHPDLAHAQVTLVQKESKAFVRITTPGPIGDPMLDIGLMAAGCGPALQRDFVLLLSPRHLPGYDRPALTTAESAAGPDAVAPETVASRRAVRYALHLDSDIGRFGLMAEKITRHKRATFARSKTNGVATTSHPQAATAVASPSPAGVPPQAVGRKEAAASGAAPAANTVLPAKPAATAAAPRRDVLVLEPPPDTAPAAATTQSGPSGGAPERAHGDAHGGSSGPATTGPGAPVLTTAPPAADVGFWKSLFPLNLLVIGLVLVFILALAFWLKRRSLVRDYTDMTEEGLSTLIPTVQHEPVPHTTAHELPHVDQAFHKPQLPAQPLDLGKAQAAATTTPAGAAPDYPTLAPEMLSADSFSVEQADSSEHVLELAEVMLAFGRTDQAIETLRQFIHDNPRQDVQPWLRLLDLYHQSAMQPEFEALSADLHQNFNVAISDWQTYAETAVNPDDTAPLDLESLPHILARLTMLWNEPESLAYLDRLLGDNRDGKRIGFAVPIVRDILMLRDILQQTHLPATTAPAP